MSLCYVPLRRKKHSGWGVIGDLFYRADSPKVCLQSKDRWKINLCKKGTTKKLEVSTWHWLEKKQKNLPWEFEPQASSLSMKSYYQCDPQKPATVDLIHTDLGLVVFPDDQRSRYTSLEKFDFNLDQWLWLDTFQYEKIYPSFRS